MKPADIEDLGAPYGADYFERYGRGPYDYQTGAPYRHGEPLWEGYFGQIADLIVSELAPRSVLDAGCAIGFLVEALRRRDVEAWGLDIAEFAIQHVPDSIRPFCQVGSVTDDLGRDYDLIVCLEVFEHLPPHLAPIAVANLSRHTQQVLFSASPDGFRDPTHLNVRPTDYWVELFARHGFFRNLEVDASVAAPQAIHFLRADQSAVSVAAAYERWHWRALTELRDLRAARQLGAEAIIRAEEAEAEMDSLRDRLEESDARGAELHRSLSERDAEAKRAEAEIAAIYRTHLFRYAAGPRRVYSRLRRHTAAESVPPPGQAGEGLIQYSLELPLARHVVASDLLLPLQGWVVSEQSAVSRIDVFINGVDCGRARLGIVRHDIGAALATPNSLLSGFEALVDLGNLSSYEDGVRIELKVETLAGECHNLEAAEVELVAPVKEARVEARVVESPHTIAQPSQQAAIRLLVFTHDLGFGGGQLYLFELLRLLARAGDLAATVVAPRDGPLRHATEELGMPVVIDGGYPVQSSDEYETRQTQLMAWAREEGFNAVLANTIGGFRGVDLAGRLGVPAVWAIHESYDIRSVWRAMYGSPDIVHPLVKACGERALESAAAVVFEAEATRSLYARHGDASRFITIPYGINIDEIDRFAASTSRAEARAKLGLPRNATVLLCLGTIEPRKAQTALAQAFQAVASAHPDAVLAFVGARLDPFSAGLEQFAEGVGLGDRVRIEPVTEEIYPWYRAADALLCASDVESLPRTVLEAMAFSVPVIATRVFGLPELIEDGITGYLCESRDTAQLVDAIERFLSAPREERTAVGAAGAAVVRKHHDSRGYAEAYHQLLRSLIEDSSRSPAEILAAT